MTVGRIRKRPPAKEIKAAVHLIPPICSLKIIKAKNIAKIGLRKVKAVASLTGINKMAVKKIATPTHPHRDRKKCRLRCVGFTSGLTKYQMKQRIIAEKKNLA